MGGLLNASFGYDLYDPLTALAILTSYLSSNAVELIVAIIALVQRKTLIVQTSLIGSILSNLLLVLGMSFFLGGIDRMEQHFNVTVAQTAASMLALAVASLIIPTAYHQWSNRQLQLNVSKLSIQPRANKNIQSRKKMEPPLYLKVGRSLCVKHCPCFFTHTVLQALASSF